MCSASARAGLSLGSYAKALALIGAEVSGSVRQHMQSNYRQDASGRQRGHRN